MALRSWRSRDDDLPIQYLRGWMGHIVQRAAGLRHGSLDGAVELAAPEQAKGRAGLESRPADSVLAVRCGSAGHVPGREGVAEQSRPVLIREPKHGNEPPSDV